MDQSDMLPENAARATLLGRVRDENGDPCLVHLRDGVLADVTAAFPLSADLLDLPDPAASLRAAPAARAWAPGTVAMLAPCDVQAVKACGVTFANSMLERVIEERTKGDPSRAAAIREQIGAAVGGALSAIRPGTPEAARAKAALQEAGYWSQYLEVGIGPDAEVFTKAQPTSAVGTGAPIGILRTSSWNNPEPEVVLAVDAGGTVKGATLGNDVNLRDVEGRSALLLGKAKDNNASCALGPFIRLFDDGFGMAEVRRLRLGLRVEGADGFVLDGFSSMEQISRDPEDLVRAAMGGNHQYPDGMMLMLGTLFAPTKDRDAPGAGFTHKEGDVVAISAPELGTLRNTVGFADALPPWEAGTRALFRSLARRGLLAG